jgi:lipoprotein-anchoring transpeptidase ErfK/SrfK
MPWSVQVNGNYFIHGFTSVPDRPASHGCIRLPLTGDNPAKRFFDWVAPGTPIEITGDWAGKPRPAQDASPTPHGR